jgi:Peptidase family M50.
MKPNKQRQRHLLDDKGIAINIRGTDITVSVLLFGLLAVYLFTLESGSHEIIIFGLLGGVIHEIGHLIAFYIVGSKPKSISVSLCGIRLVPSGRILSRRKELFTLAAGPLFNLLTALIFWKTKSAAMISLALMLFNLFPISPLDGGRMLSLYLPQKLCRGISIVFLTLCLAFGAYLAFAHGNYSLIITSIYLIFIQ